ncbi:MAG: CvpA family protein [Treponema sp.]|nr:CvpA family protein [Treponema sp.]MCL2252342.1 CvpA family protein [Treponema sp.]
MSVIDVIFIILIALFMIRCFLKGFISELLSMAAFVFGIIAALFFYKNGGVYLRENFFPEMNNPIPEILSFIALFLIVFIISKFLDMLLRGVIYGIKLGGADKLLGLVFGFIEGLVVVCLVLFVMHIQPLFNAAPVFESSFFAKMLLPLIAEAGSLKHV